MSATSQSITHVDSGEHVHETGKLIAEGDAHVINHDVVFAWDDSIIEALPGSTTHVFSDAVSVRKHTGARIVQKAGRAGSQAVITQV